MNDYQEKLKELEKSRCETCYGRGKVDTTELGDTWCSERKCLDCSGTGFYVEKVK